LGEFGEEVDAAGVGFFVVGEAETLNLFDLAGALVGAIESEEGDGMDALVEADALGKESNGVLPENAVENGHLSNL
jgi:hypothetical protein